MNKAKKEMLQDDVIDILSAIEMSDSSNESLRENIVAKETTENSKKIKNYFQNFCSGIYCTFSKKYSTLLTKKLKSSKKVSQTTNQEKSKIKKQNSATSRLFSAGFFCLKYILTSVGIFGVLLLSTNYAAYSNIALSYIFKDEVNKSGESLMNLVNAGAIEENIPEKVEVVKKTKEEKLLEMELSKKEANIKEDKYSINRLVSSIDKDGIDLGIDIVPYENRIIIPKIAKNIPLVEVQKDTVENETELNDIFMKELEEGIVRYPGSARPGEIGNSFVFGHSSNFPWIPGEYNDVFARLGQVNKDDIVIAYYGQKKYTYKIKEKKVITPHDVDILKRDENLKEITLMTCWPVGTTLNRLILIGELIEE